MTREEKQKQAEALRGELQKAHTIILSKFEGLTVAQDTELRRKLAQTGARYKVVKNKLVERAAQGTPVETMARDLKGTTSLAYTESDAAALAKVLTAYSKENPALVFKVGMVEGRVISLADLASIASLPKKEELFSKLLFLIHSPAQRLAYALSGIAQELASVIHQAVKEKKFREAAGG